MSRTIILVCRHYNDVEVIWYFHSNVFRYFPHTVILDLAWFCFMQGRGCILWLVIICVDFFKVTVLETHHSSQNKKKSDRSAFWNLQLQEIKIYTVDWFFWSLYKANKLKTLCNHIFTLQSAYIPIKCSSLKRCPDVVFIWNGASFIF